MEGEREEKRRGWGDREVVVEDKNIHLKTKPMHPCIPLEIFSWCFLSTSDTRRPDELDIGVRWYKDLRNTTSSKQKTRIILIQAP